MSHTYVSGLVHCVFSTQHRDNSIPGDRQAQLWSYLGGIARKNGFNAIAIGGIENHIHILLSLPATMPLAKAVQHLKGGSSKRMNETGAGRFAWQEGYGAFTVGISPVFPSKPAQSLTSTPRQNITESAISRRSFWRS